MEVWILALLRNYKFRNFVKEKICQAFDAIEYSRNHPYTRLKQISHESTVEFVISNCPNATPCRTPKQLMALALSKVSLDGLFIEFGVFKGDSIRYIAKKYPEREIHGFDSFEGLPEAWLHNPRGAFSVQGKLPRVPKNVHLWKGYFEDTLPGWVNEHKTPIAFIHVDCDLMSSTQVIFSELQKIILPGVVVVFDDYFNFPMWEKDGHSVLTSYLQRSGLTAEYIGYAYKELAIILR
jgi:hypothetical protein